MSKQSNDYDVIVVGAGNTALLTALRAREFGARVLVLEVAPKEKEAGTLTSRPAFTASFTTVLKTCGI